MYKKHSSKAYVALWISLSLLLTACSIFPTTASSSNQTPVANRTPIPTNTSPTPTIAIANLGTPGTFNCVPGTLTADGSSAIQQLVQQVANLYQTKCPQANITVKPNGSSRGLTEVAVGSVQIGDSDIAAPSPMHSELVDHQIAIGIFTVVVNDQVTGITNLSSVQLRGIYNHTITNWKAIGGPNLPIHVFCRIPGSGTRQTFDTYILHNAISPACEQIINTSDVLAKALHDTAGAIGYDILNIAQKNHLSFINIDGYPPTLDAIRQNKYIYWNVEHMYSQPSPPANVQAFLDYMYSADAAQIIHQLGFLSMNDIPSTIISVHLGAGA